MALVRCPKCGEEVKDGKTCVSCGADMALYTKKFCVFCNKTLENEPGEVRFVVCPQCGKHMDSKESKCPDCGMDFEEIEKRLCYKCCDKLVKKKQSKKVETKAETQEKIEERETKDTNEMLGKCPVCAGIVSKKAVTCPHCGQPLKNISLFGKKGAYVQWFFTCFSLALQILILIVLILT